MEAFSLACLTCRQGREFARLPKYFCEWLAGGEFLYYRSLLAQRKLKSGVGNDDTLRNARQAAQLRNHFYYGIASLPAGDRNDAALLRLLDSRAKTIFKIKTQNANKIYPHLAVKPPAEML
ncbi:MAG: hypothetical protein A2339_05425 [Elusimicrobia bacterium RIFOXYB12_FULL_50_12]|nr:MAG: hypothetical protein A2278_01135 [Elusimicrobia bacterium RIFOXYA12_FULL_49_49]OGS11086.1 MAG: hypothetical protein A2386_03695 [Elusimicrobia bacterium RIFOXYB1_FULL_48_9]OGS15801.1 MAG: hypothetical protein A2251_04035 [Elusimicrobia bacterium RIFOXYA2_FULL_47_53]OGS25989.1 MAG: hypothetical protein A2339_05425 [Elusimicrobia bacterium RIFOXYB12_FULL_50_12]OGS31133.1 MAG: hypothetical protein A2323_08755 [Elusimicrobia bacterium RIFOXYB2_FULL_46_23]